MGNLSTYFFTFLTLVCFQSFAQRNDIEELIRNEYDSEAVTLITNSIDLGTMTTVDALHLIRFAMVHEQPLSFLALLTHPGLDPRVVILEGTSTIRIADLVAMTTMERHMMVITNPRPDDVPLDFDLVMSAFNHMFLLYNVLEHDNFAFLIQQGLGDLNFVFRAIYSLNNRYSLDLICLSVTILNRARTLAAVKHLEELQDLYQKILALRDQHLKRWMMQQEQLLEFQLILNQTQANDAPSDDGDWVLPDLL